MRVVATSDFHGTLPEIPECDLLLIGGDICPVWDHTLPFQRHWLRTTFDEWLRSVPANNIVGIAGNHDFIAQDVGGDELLHKDLPWTYLKNETKIVNVVDAQGNNTPLKIYGSPYSNKFGGWAFMKTESQLSYMWNQIPRDSDIVLVHGPPWGFGDQVLGFSATKRGMVEPEHVGSTSLANQLFYELWPNLKLIVFGHIHEGYGKYSMKNINMLNVSHMNDEYKPMNPPMVIEL